MIVRSAKKIGHGVVVHGGRFRRDRRGAITVLFALMIGIIATVVGVAIDFTRVRTAHAAMQHAADATALMAVSQLGGIQVSEAEAKTYFLKAASIEDGVVALDIKIVENKGEKVATVTFNRKVDLYLGSFIGQSQSTISGTSVAQAAMTDTRRGHYLDIAFALDVSGSMGLAATDDGQKKLTQLTGCAFGCHITYSGKGTTNLSVARNNNIKLRLDVMRDATVAIIDELNSANLQMAASVPAAEKASFRMPLRSQIFTFARLMEELVPLTSDATLLRTAALAIDFPKSRSDNDSNTWLDNSVKEIGLRITSGGDGTKSDSPEKYMFLVTDGLHDTNHHDHRPKVSMRAIDTKLCDDIKARGIKIAVLHVQYLENTGEYWFERLVRPVFPDMTTKLQQCASEGFYYHADKPEEIANSMRTFFAVANKTPRLTN